MGVEMKGWGLRILPVVFVIIAVLCRLLPHPANVAPVSALALFSGVYLPKRFAFIVPFSAVFISDWFLGFYGPTMFFVYGSYFLCGLLGMWLRNRVSLGNTILGSLGCSICFFVVSNLGVWISGQLYSFDMKGLIECFVAALPFFRNTLFGDLMYVGLFFGGYYVVNHILKRVLPKQIYHRLV